MYFVLMYTKIFFIFFQKCIPAAQHSSDSAFKKRVCASAPEKSTQEMLRAIFNVKKQVFFTFSSGLIETSHEEKQVVSKIKRNYYNRRRSKTRTFPYLKNCISKKCLVKNFGVTPRNESLTFSPNRQPSRNFR